MTPEQIREWNDLRLELFAGVKLPDYALAAILHDLRTKDYDRAMRALPIYRAKRPFKGFYAVDWERVYQQTSRVSPADGTDRAGSPAARSWEEQEREKAEADKRREVREYLAIPESRREEAIVQLRHLGWTPSNESRAWRMLVILWHRGEDVSSMYHPTKLGAGSVVEEKRQVFLTREERIRELEALIKGSTWELERLRTGGAA